MKKIIVSISLTDLLLPVFFLSIFIALFMGDGKQPLVEIFYAVIIPLLFLINNINHTKSKPLPFAINILWIVVITYFIIRSVFSDSVSYSISETIRLIEGYLIFLLFYSSFQSGQLLKYMHWLKAISILALLSCGLYLLFPSLTNALPQMNLLFGFYAHNHLAAILVMIFPLAFESFFHKLSKISLLYVFVVSIGIITTWARGAYLIIFLYLFFRFRYLFTLKSKKLIAITITLGTVLLSLFLILSFSKLSFVADKKAPLTESRIKFWEQALAAFNNRPIFGSGPGTFILLSKRFQNQPTQFSLFSHSFPLQFLAELGLVGSIPLLLLFIMIFYQIRQISFKQWNNEAIKQSNDINYQSLLYGSILTVVYSFLDFNLNFLVIWLLFWSTMGILFRLSSNNQSINQTYNKHSAISNHQIFKVIMKQWSNGAIIILVAFYLLSIVSIIATENISDPAAKSLANYFAPFRTGSTVSLLKYYSKLSTILPDLTDNLIIKMHIRDPEVLVNYADYEVSISEINKADNFYKKAIHLDPKNFNLYRSYIRFIIQKQKYDQAGFIFMNLNKNLIPEANLSQINFESPLLKRYYTENLLLLLDSNVRPNILLAKADYLLGLELLNQNPELTESLWSLASASAPDWSHFYIELASLEKYILNNDSESKNIINKCISNIYAKSHCIEVQKSSLHPPGFLSKQITSIN